MAAMQQALIFGNIVNPNYLWDTSFSNGAAGLTVVYSENNAVSSATLPGFAPGTNFGTISKTPLSGKVYAEFVLLSQSSSLNFHAFGLINYPTGSPSPYSTNNYSIFSRYPNLSAGCGLTADGYNNNNSIVSSTTYAFGVNDRIGIAFDATTGKLWFSKNGIWLSGNPNTDTSPTMTIPVISTYRFTWSNYTCLATDLQTSARIYPSAATQLYTVPTGFTAYQS